MSSTKPTGRANSEKAHSSQAVVHKVFKQTLMRHAKWLVDTKYLAVQSDVIGVADSAKEKSSNGETATSQRTLLLCEKEKVVERQKRMEEHQLLIDKVVAFVARKTEALLVERLTKTDIDKLFLGFPDFASFASFAYSASLDFPKLNALMVNHRFLRMRILKLVADAGFCSLLGKQPRHTKDPMVAVGYIGIENCRRLFPILMAKSLLKLNDKNTKLIAPKMWTQLFTTANATRMRLEDAKYKEPDEGVMIGVVRSLALFVICNHFSSVFEEAWLYAMKMFKKNKDMGSYSVCSEIEPTISILPKLIYNLDRVLTKRIVEHIEWNDRTIHLKNAILEDVAGVPILKRSIHGIALGQARAFTIFDMMEKNGAFVREQISPWFLHAKMNKANVKSLLKRNPSKLTLL